MIFKGIEECIVGSGVLEKRQNDGLSHDLHRNDFLKMAEMNIPNYK